MSTIDSSNPLRVTFCRYVENKLERTEQCLGEVEYIAICHVWGRDADWRKIPSLEDKVVLSLEKAAFLTDQLPDIVGENWFWLDVLCVDQRDGAARVAVTQHIPAIFRRAYKTLVVTESTGVRHCCSKATEDFCGLLHNVRGTSHYDANPDHMPSGNDGILTRLWPYQEILLSDTLQFVRCISPHMAMSTGQGQRDALVFANISLSWLARAWRDYRLEGPSQKEHNITVSFIQAYIENGIISRPKTSRAIELAVQFTCSMFEQRITSKARDFVLATMPHTEWYVVPSQAKDISFGQLLIDFCHQAALNNVHFVRCPITNAKAGLEDIIFRPPMMQDIPIPTTLSGFAMLMHHHIWFGVSTKIRIRPAPVRLLFDYRNISILEVVKIVTSSMNISRFVWNQRLNQKNSAISSYSRWQSSRRLDHFTHDDILMLLYLVKCQGWDSEICWSEIEETLQMSSNNSQFIETLLRIASLICAGIESSALQWCERNLTPILVEFEENWVLALAFNHVVEEFKRGECEFFLVNVWRWTVLVAKETCPPMLYSRCIFPFVYRDGDVPVE